MSFRETKKCVKCGHIYFAITKHGHRGVCRRSTCVKGYKERIKRNLVIFNYVANGHAYSDAVKKFKLSFGTIRRICLGFSA